MNKTRCGHLHVLYWGLSLLLLHLAACDGDSSDGGHNDGGALMGAGGTGGRNPDGDPVGGNGGGGGEPSGPGTGGDGGQVDPGAGGSGGEGDGGSPTQRPPGPKTAYLYAPDIPERNWSMFGVQMGGSYLPNYLNDEYGCANAKRVPAPGPNRQIPVTVGFRGVGINGPYVQEIDTFMMDDEFEPGCNRVVILVGCGSLVACAVVDNGPLSP